jgi:hypothetical protein
VSVHTSALQPALKSAPGAASRLSLISANAVPERIRSIPLAPAVLPEAPRPILPASAAAQPPHVTLVVSRFDVTAAARGTCALCWSGPEQLAGSVHRRGSVFTEDDAKGICNRCLVTLEMLAVQFEPELRLQIETPA